MLLMTANFSALSSFFKLIGLLILLIVLLFAASFVSKWYAGAMSGKKYAGNIKIIETYPIGQGKMIQITVYPAFFYVSVFPETSQKNLLS